MESTVAGIMVGASLLSLLCLLKSLETLFATLLTSKFQAKVRMQHYTPSIEEHTNTSHAYVNSAATAHTLITGTGGAAKFVSVSPKVTTKSLSTTNKITQQVQLDAYKAALNSTFGTKRR